MKTPTKSELGLEVHGPFEVPFERNENGAKHILSDRDGSFWAEVPPEVGEGCGIYIMSIGRVPWYVGLSARSFRQEAFTPDKLNKFNSAVFACPRGRPFLTFLRVTDPDSSCVEEVRDIEKVLISLAYGINRQLINKHHVNGAWRNGPTGRAATETAAALKALLDW